MKNEKIKAIKEFSLDENTTSGVKKEKPKEKFIEINTIEYWKTADIYIIGNGITEKELIEIIAKEQKPKPEVIKFIKDNFNLWEEKGNKFE